MRFFRPFLLIVFSMAIYESAFSQGLCGTEKVSYEEYSKFIERSSFKNNDAEYVVPIQVHIVTNSSGQAFEAKVSDVLAALNKAEEFFRSSNIRFSICGVSTVPNSRLLEYDITDYSDFSELHSFSNQKALNIFFTQTVISSDGGAFCGVASFPWDGLFSSITACLEPSIVAHEIGHMLGLLHTHERSGTQPERVDGSNCGEAGDFLCDTPADPGLNYSNVNQFCFYEGMAIDETGAPYRPNTGLIMSYSPGSCKDQFSEEQGQVMRYAIEEYLDLLHCGEQAVPSLADLENTDLLIFPNPATEVLNIVFDANINYLITLYNLRGEIMESSRNENEMNVEHLPRGIYLLECTESTTGFRQFKRVVLANAR